MKALIYIALISLVLWAGVAWEQAHAPAPIATEDTEEVATSTPPIVEDAEPEVEVTVAITEQKTSTPKPATPAPAEPELVENDGYTEEFVVALEMAIHARVNDERKLQGLDTLEYDDVLAEVAAYHSTDMAKEDYFAHEDENGCDSSCRVTSSGYKWRMVGENLFLLKRSEPFSVDGASAIVVAGWMGSPGHRKNLFEEDFTHQGMGVVIKGDSLYVTEVLARPR